MIVECNGAAARIGSTTFGSVSDSLCANAVAMVPHCTVPVYLVMTPWDD